MFDSSWSENLNKSKPRLLLPKYDNQLEISHKAFHYWQEHCVECSAPDCYSSCLLYKKRADNNCSRFVKGIELIKDNNFQLADIIFRRWAKLETKWYRKQRIWETTKIKKLSSKMETLKITPSKASKFGINIAKDGISRTASQILSQKGVEMSKFRDIWPEIENYSKEIDSQIEIIYHYKGYLKKQKADIMAFKKDENLKIPENINYDIFSGLSNEVKSKFKQIRPKTLGQALRIDGITPAAVYILLSHVKRKYIKQIA